MVRQSTFRGETLYTDDPPAAFASKVKHSHHGKDLNEETRAKSAKPTPAEGGKSEKHKQNHSSGGARAEGEAAAGDVIIESGGADLMEKRKGSKKTRSPSEGRKSTENKQKKTSKGSARAEGEAAGAEVVVESGGG
eukprot:CAMPEP_0178990304 /NCGR_PEP_ID=MMETSP0795-20121207/4859_1 /TAXON_ID=88552 /ORGANISM="Amoebophrya sp., Strain Ameob2" /LENGTH=135 /DNA_ID=CAMNT_0020681809 /DNA_START=69 /DNA_END=473 /DNA_ORIENTATION=+